VREPAIQGADKETGKGTYRRPLRARIEKSTSARLALVSRQFRQECRDTAKANAILVLEDTRSWNAKAEVKLATEMLVFRKIAIYLAVNELYDHDEDEEGAGCDGDCEAVLHQTWIKALVAQRSYTPSLAIHLYLADARGDIRSNLAALRHLVGLQSLPGLTSFDIYACDAEYEAWDFPDASHVILRRSSRDNELKAVEQAKDGDKATESVDQTAEA